jgi:hypothetical protein
MLAFMVILWYISTTRHTLELGLSALMQRREVGAKSARTRKMQENARKCKKTLDLYAILFVYLGMKKRGKMMSFG